ncbi:MAG: saccharopine dehydrogenase NADP-binding domain-containing protein [Anaerolineae bacterium]|nr:saccharopine dehydrogenase NADP-binding domain-containing protein [Anaerolineae bacterium]
MTHITVLGAGLVGSAIVKDLAREARFAVTAVDFNQAALDKLATEGSTGYPHPITTVQADLQSMHDLTPLIADSDLVICAVPGFMGFATLKKIIQASKNVVDISFFPEDAFLLDELAQSQGVTAVVDCGVAPGLCNIQAGYADTLLDHVERYECYVGGLPHVRQWPYEYKAVFSPVDVLEEYTRPARFVEYGQNVVRPALSDVELLDFPGVGTLEAFNTDGLRSLQRTLCAPFMKEKTLRYPGHVNLMRVFRDSGFFDTHLVEVGGNAIRPIDLTAKLIFKQWQLQPGEEDFTVMRVVVEGEKAGKSRRYTYDLLDRYDHATQTTSMARTTGYTCTLVARMVLDRQFTQKGICPPEYVGRTEGCYTTLLDGYAERNIYVTETH